MEDQTTAVAEVGCITVIVLFVGIVGIFDVSTGLNTIFTQEGNVVGLVDLNTSNFVETFT